MFISTFNPTVHCFIRLLCRFLSCTSKAVRPRCVTAAYQIYLGIKPSFHMEMNSIFQYTKLRLPFLQQRKYLNSINFGAMYYILPPSKCVHSGSFFERQFWSYKYQNCLYMVCHFGLITMCGEVTFFGMHGKFEHGHRFVLCE